jgi:hypothetical protein
MTIFAADNKEMKYSTWLGIGAALLVIAACYMPWAYYPDLQKEFTGFFSEMNRYGKPGKVLIFLSILEVILFLVSKVWAKRTNIFVAAIAFAWGIRSYILYTGCYRGICPERRIGMYLVLGGTLLALIAALTPRMGVERRSTPEEPAAKSK